MNRVKRYGIASWLNAAGSFGPNVLAARSAAHCLAYSGEPVPESCVRWLLEEMRKGGVNCDLAIDLVSEFQVNGQIKRGEAAA